MNEGPEPRNEFSLELHDQALQLLANLQESVDALGAMELGEARDVVDDLQGIIEEIRDSLERSRIAEAR